MTITRRIRVTAVIAVATACLGATAPCALALNPQPLPPRHAVTTLRFLNPQPLPPFAR